MIKNKQIEENTKSDKPVEVEEMSNSTIGFLQAVLVVIYCVVISGFFWLMEEQGIHPPRILVSMLMLLLLVFSVAVSGVLVFGYPTYIALNKKDFKKSLAILGYTFLFFILIIVLILLFILL